MHEIIVDQLKIKEKRKMFQGKYTKPKIWVEKEKRIVINIKLI